MKTPIAAESLGTPRTDAVNAMAQQIVSRKDFGNSTADTINEIVALYSKHAESLETFNLNAVKRGDDLQRKLTEAHAAAQQRIVELERALESSSRVLALSAEILKDGPHTGKIKYLEQQIERNRLALRHPERTLDMKTTFTLTP